MSYIDCPRILRTDRVTENTNLSFLQPFLRDDGEDDFAKEKSFMYGWSMSNQVGIITVCVGLWESCIIIPLMAAHRGMVGPTSQ